MSYLNLQILRRTTFTIQYKHIDCFWHKDEVRYLRVATLVKCPKEWPVDDHFSRLRAVLKWEWFALEHRLGYFQQEENLIWNYPFALLPGGYNLLQVLLVIRVPKLLQHITPGLQTTTFFACKGKDYIVFLYWHDLDLENGIPSN